MPYSVLSALSTTALLRLAVAVVLYAVLHLVRLPLVLAAAVLAVSLHRVAAYTAELTAHPSPPVALPACPHREGRTCDAS